jgi:cyanophycinase-like exopeptidase
MFKPLVSALKAQLKKGQSMLGIDENTAAIAQPDGEWKVMGQGQVHVFGRTGNATYKPGQTFRL